MKKLKKLVAAVMMIAVMMSLTACAEVTLKTKIYSDGSAYIVADVYMDRDMVIKSYDEAIYEASGEHMDDSLIQQLDESMSEGNNCEIVNKDDKTYYHMIEKEKVKKENLNKYFSGDSVKEYVDKNVVYLEIDGISDAEINQMYEQYGDSNANINDYLKYTLEFEFPKEIKAVKGGHISERNPKKVIFELDAAKKNVLFATTSDNVTIKSVKDKIKKLNQIAATKITKKNVKKNTATLTLKKVKGASTYKVEYSVKKNFKNSKTKLVTGNKVVLNNLKKGTKYYVRVSACKKNYAQKYVYSKAKVTTITTKKK